MKSADTEFQQKLKGLMLFRVLFAFLLFGSTIFYRMTKTPSPTPLTVIIIFGLTGLIIILSVGYFSTFRFFKTNILFAYAQLTVDTVLTTFIIMVTGSFSSVFNFMYLVIVMCAGMLLFRKGSLIIATLCAFQYAGLISYEYRGYIDLFSMEDNLAEIGKWYVIFKTGAIIGACYLVALLVSFLAEREKYARLELERIEKHLKRVERTAAIGEMAAGLAHEIKNPLASMTGSIQLLKEDTDIPADKMKLMQIILREADRLNTLVTDFLLYAKPKTGTAQLIQLEEAIREMVALFANDRTFQDRITFNICAADSVWIQMDPGHLRQILWNLFLNAAQAIADRGTITIEMFTKREYVALAITDNGCGMDTQTLKKAFDPFFTTRSDGTGLGLAIVHRIISDYEGQLDVDSRVGTGTKFTITLKRATP